MTSVEAAEARAVEAEANMFQAAEYGKQILVKLNESESLRTQLEQDKHSLKLSLQSKEADEKAMQEEILGKH